MDDLPDIGATLAVMMPCGQEALAKVLYHKRRNDRFDFIGLRIQWLPATNKTVRGYTLNWGNKIEGLVEGNLPYPPNPAEKMYGSVQMGQWRVVV